MPVDPDEIKIEQIKRQQKTDEVQKYMEEQDALDKESATGKLGHHEVKRGTISAKLRHLFELMMRIIRGNRT